MLSNKIFLSLSVGLIFIALSMSSLSAIAQPMNLTVDNTTIVSAEVHSATSTLTLGPNVNVNPTGSLTIGAPDVYIIPKLHILTGGKLYIVTAPVDVSNDELINPFGLHVAQAYPNPFRESIQIDFTLEKPGRVDIMVYDAIGKKIKNLVSASRLPGSHSIKWDGTTHTGARISNGIYYIRFATENYQTTQKAIFME